MIGILVSTITLLVGVNFLKSGTNNISPGQMKVIDMMETIVGEHWKGGVCIMCDLWSVES